MRSTNGVLTFSLTLLIASIVACASASAATCASLTSLSLPNTTITLAQSYTAGETVSGTTTAPAGLCRVAGTVTPTSQSNIHFEVWIPTDGSWNGKYQQIGNGGFAGSISIATIANAVSRGYASAGTDDGTSGPPSGAPTFIGNPQVLIDYGYRAIKVTTDDSKAIIQALMGQTPRYSYFVGCSDGGREALQEAQRYPDDFNGIIVGSPVNDQVGEFGSSYLYDMEVTLNGPQTAGVPNAYIPSSMLTLLSTPALAKCAGKDGGVATDAFLSDPRQCFFDPGVAECTAWPESQHVPDGGSGRSGEKDLFWAAQSTWRAALPWLRARRRIGLGGLEHLDLWNFPQLPRRAIHARLWIHLRPAAAGYQLRLPQRQC